MAAIASLDDWAAAAVFWKTELTVSSLPTWSEAKLWEEAHLSPNLSRQHETGIFLMMSLSWKLLKAHCKGGSLVGLNSPWASPNGPSFDETHSLSKAGKNMLDVVYPWDHPGGSSSCLRILVKKEGGRDGSFHPQGDMFSFNLFALKNLLRTHLPMVSASWVLGEIHSLKLLLGNFVYLWIFFMTLLSLFVLALEWITLTIRKWI